MIGIVILNYNNWKDTVMTINSFTNHYNDENHKIYLVDNNSKIKPTEEELVEINKFTNLEIIYNKENKGYSAGNNIGIKKAIEDKVKKIIISNNDIIVNEQTIPKLSDFLDSNSNVGIVGPKVYLGDGSIQEINLVTELTLSKRYKLLINKFSMGLLFRKTFKDFYYLNEPKENFSVFAVSGCFFMLSLDLAKDLYPFDEDYFLYMEEATIGVRLKKENIETYYVTDSEIIHLHGQSTKANSWRSYTFFIRSEIIYFKKYYNKSYIKLLPLYALRKIQFYSRVIFKKGFFRKRKFMKEQTKIIYKKIRGI